MQAKFFFIGPPGSARSYPEVEEELNNFLNSVKVVQVLQSSAAYTRRGTELAELAIETMLTVLYEPKS